MNEKYFFFVRKSVQDYIKSMPYAERVKGEEVSTQKMSNWI